jgi:hypothetical protein
MTRPEKKRQTKEQMAITLIEKMFYFAGHDIRYKDVEGRTDNWYQQWTMTEAQNKEWKEWGTKFIKTKLRTNLKSAQTEMAWFDLCYGLTISDWLQNHPEYAE